MQKSLFLSLLSCIILYKKIFHAHILCECIYAQASTATSQSHAISTWPPPGAQEAVSVANTDRPHTISSAYERGHQRPALTVYTFQNPDQNISENNSNSNSNSNLSNGSGSTAQKSPASVANRPPLPIVMIFDFI